MELIDVIRIIRRRMVLIVLVVIACVAGAAVATTLSTKRYSASARLIVSGSSSISATDEIATRELADARAVAFAQIAGTGPAVQAAITYANQTKGPFAKTGGPAVSAGASGTDPFVIITVTDTDPRRAQAVANSFVQVLPSVLAHLEQPSVTPNEISVLDSAGLPGKPYTPKRARNLVIGFALGLVLGGGGALVQESLDRRLKDSDDVEAATGLPILGVVPYDMPGETTPAESHPLSVRAEAYRKVRTNLFFVTLDGPPKSVMVTSATSAEGKTSLATNLALACVRSGQRVALVDADLRRPMVHLFLETPEHSGLVDVLADTSTLDQAIQTIHDGALHVLVAGPVPANPSELIGSEAMLNVIRELERRYDLVIIDTPPVLPVSDALLIGVNVDAVVIVTRLGETTRDRLRRTRDALLNVHTSIAGVVPNGAVQREDSAYAYAYRYRSKAKSPVLPYAPRDPVVEPHPEDLRPAGRAPVEVEPQVVAPASENGASSPPAVAAVYTPPPLAEPAPSRVAEPVSRGRAQRQRASSGWRRWLS